MQTTATDNQDATCASPDNDALERLEHTRQEFEVVAAEEGYDLERADGTNWRIPKGSYLSDATTQAWSLWERAAQFYEAKHSALGTATALDNQHDLLPCPCCNSIPELVDQGTGSWRVACRISKGGCGVSTRMSFDKGVTAVAEWNRRPK